MNLKKSVRLPNLPHEAKIAELDGILLNQDIFRFEVSMEEALGVQELQALHTLKENDFNVSFGVGIYLVKV